MSIDERFTFAIDVVTEAGVPFKVRAIPAGSPAMPLHEDTRFGVVMFYDRRSYADTDNGQRVRSYRLDTLMNPPVTGGLDLHIGSHDWAIDAQTMIVINRWLENLRPYLTGA